MLIELTIGGPAVSLDAEPEMPQLGATSGLVVPTGGTFVCGETPGSACNLHVGGELPAGVGVPGAMPVGPAAIDAYFRATGNGQRALPLPNAGLA